MQLFKLNLDNYFIWGGGFNTYHSDDLTIEPFYKGRDHHSLQEHFIDLRSITKSHPNSYYYRDSKKLLFLAIHNMARFDEISKRLS